MKDYQRDNSPIMLGSIACVKRCSSWYFLSPPDQFNVLQIDFSIDNLEEHKRGEVLRVHHYCSSNAIHSALTAIRSNMQTSILHSAIFFFIKIFIRSILYYDEEDKRAVCVARVRDGWDRKSQTWTKEKSGFLSYELLPLNCPFRFHIVCCMFS